MGRATDDVADALHGLMAEAQLEALKRNLTRARLPKTITVKEDGKDVTKPNPDYEPLDTKLLAVIRAFLKDNGIDAPASSQRFSGLADELRNLRIDDGMGTA